MNHKEQLKFLGSKIKAIRKSKGLKQEFIAKKTGISQTYLSQIEAGKKNATLIVLFDLAYVLNVDVVDFFFREQCL